MGTERTEISQDTFGSEFAVFLLSMVCFKISVLFWSMCDCLHVYLYTVCLNDAYCEKSGQEKREASNSQTRDCEGCEFSHLPCELDGNRRASRSHQQGQTS